VEAIVQHLRALLNTRRGEAPSAPALGVIDFSDVAGSFPGGTSQLAASMRATLLEHEPRIKSVSVRHVPSEGELVLRFEVIAQLAARGGRTLRLSTTVRPGGRIDVSG
jgi:type VI secretion system protein